MAEPIVTITNIERTKISAKPTVNTSNIIFGFDVPVQAYSIRIGGTDHFTGLEADRKSFYISDLATKKVGDITLQTAKSIRQIDGDTGVNTTIEHSNLVEGANRVNIYGQSLDGSWTQYEI